MYLVQQHSQRHRVSRAAQDLSATISDSGLTGSTANIATMQKDSGVSVPGGMVPLTTSMSTFENFMPWVMPMAPAQHMVIPAVSMQHAAQGFPVMFSETEQTMYSTAASQELLPVSATSSNTMLRQPTAGKPHDAEDTGVSVTRQLPEYFTEAQVFPDHMTSEKVVELSHTRKESDSGVHLHEVNSGASGQQVKEPTKMLQGARLQSASLTPHGSPVLQHKQSHGTTVTSTSLAGYTPSMMLQPKVLPAYSPMPSLAPHQYIMAPHQMSTFTPQQLQMLQQQQQLQQYNLQNSAPSAMPQLPPQQQRGGFVMQQQKQPPQFLQQSMLRNPLLDANAVASYMVSQQYQQMALSSTVPPSWLYMPSVAPMPASHPQFTPAPASQPAAFMPANPVPSARPVITQSAPMIPVSQPTTSVPVATVPPVTNGT